MSGVRTRSYTRKGRAATPIVAFVKLHPPSRRRRSLPTGLSIGASGSDEQRNAKRIRLDQTDLGSRAMHVDDDKGMENMGKAEKVDASDRHPMAHAQPASGASVLSPKPMVLDHPSDLNLRVFAEDKEGDGADAGSKMAAAPNGLADDADSDRPDMDAHLKELADRFFDGRLPPRLLRHMARERGRSHLPETGEEDVEDDDDDDEEEDGSFRGDASGSGARLEASASMGFVGDPLGAWTCEECTFSNAAGYRRCDACGSSRPKFQPIPAHMPVWQWYDAQWALWRDFDLKACFDLEEAHQTSVVSNVDVDASSDLVDDGSVVKVPIRSGVFRNKPDHYVAFERSEGKTTLCEDRTAARFEVRRNESVESVARAATEKRNGQIEAIRAYLVPVTISAPAEQQQAPDGLDEEDSTISCPICLDGFTSVDFAFKLNRCVGGLVDGHHFHDRCIIDWMLKRSTCPACLKDYPIPELALNRLPSGSSSSSSSITLMVQAQAPSTNDLASSAVDMAQSMSMQSLVSDAQALVGEASSI